MSKTAYPIVIVELSKADGGGFAAFAPDLYGCMSDGATQLEALQNIQDAILEWIDEAERLNYTIPEPGSCARAITEERNALIQFFRDNLGKLDELEAKISELERSMEHVSGRLNEPIECTAFLEFLPSLTHYRASVGKIH